MVSTTLTVLVAVPTFPLESVAVYVIVYVPRVDESADPVVTTLTVPERSVAVAPASTYVLPAAKPVSSTLISASPVTVTTGAVVSTTLTVLVAEPVFPLASVDE